MDISSFLDRVCKEMEGVFDVYLKAYTLVKNISTLVFLDGDTKLDQTFNKTLVKVFGICRKILKLLKEAREALEKTYNYLGEGHHPAIDLQTVKYAHKIQKKASKKIKILCKSTLRWLKFLLAIIYLQMADSVAEDTNPSESN